jgi:signal transduction histidine kinase
MPIFKNNKMLGSIFFQISYEDIFQLLKENKRHSDYENLILRSDESIMIQSKDGFVDTTIQYPKIEDSLSIKNFGYHEGSGYTHQKAFIAYSKININPDLSWILITEYSASMLNSTFLSLQKAFFIIIIIVFITIVTLSFLLRKKIVDPLILEKERIDLYQMNIYSENLRTLGVLASGMAHELNNPLTIIEGSLTLMNKHIKEPNINASFIQNKLDMATKACNRMSKIIRHMLDLSRDSRAEEKLNMSLNAVISGALYFYEEKFRHKGITVILDLDPQLPKTNLYPTKMETVILNLLSNSFDSLTEIFAIESKKKEIHIKTYVKNSFIYFQLIDTGGGISPDVIKNIFVPFFTTKVVGKGTGLGLSITHEFIQLHKGQIEITSQLNESTTVLFWLPIE